MRKHFKTLSLLLAVCMTGGILASCSGRRNDSGATGAVATPDYDAELLSEKTDVSSGYNSNLFYVNTLEFEIADPSVIYVSEGTDAGWFYAYGTSDEIGCHGVQSWRSKDLSHWECTGIAFQPDYAQAWAVDNYWAPEVIYDAEAKLYYMFYNAYNQYDGNRLCLSVAYSASPSGPFVSPDGRRNADGQMLSAGKPVYDLTTENSALAALEESNPGIVRTHALDASPFIDPVTGDKYLYFSYYNDYGSEGSFVYGMKMKDWLTPDYSTLKILTYPGYLTVAGGIDRDISERVSEGNVNEGPFMIYNEGKYYLTLSVFGYTDPNYRVIQAIADAPLGDFTKIPEEKGGKVISTDTGSWTHIVSAGHHSFIRCGEELFIAYHTFKNRNDISGGRALALDKVVWTKNADGVSVMHANGPTWSVQPLPEFLSGYKNIALSADLTADNTADGSDAKLLTDGMVKYQELDLAEEYEAKSGLSTIRLSWDDFKTVRGVMVYNSYDYEKTFVSVEKIEMEYRKGDGSTGRAVIENVAYDWAWHFESDFEFIRPGGAAIAEMNELPVKSMTITVRSAANAENLALGEIVVLGKDEACAGVDEFGAYSYTNAEYGSAHLIKDSATFGSVEGTTLSTDYGYDLSHDDGTDGAYIEQTGVSDQYAYFKDVYADSFYAEAEITVTAAQPFSRDAYPKFGIAMSCDDDYSNTVFYYVDAVGYSKQTVGCAQRTLDNKDWDWNATEQLVSVGGISYTGDNYVKLAVLRVGSEFYFLCNDKVVITHNSFNVFGDTQKAAVGFLSFNTPMKIRNYSATADESVVAAKKTQYADSISGDTFGKVGSYTCGSGWDFGNDRGDSPMAMQTEVGDQYAYFKQINDSSFYVETEISVIRDLEDPFPKFGLAARVGGNTFFFYIDGSNGYESQRVGYVSYNADGGWGWGTSLNAEKTVSLGSYKNGNYAKLGMLRDGDTFKLYVNGELVFTVTGLRGFGKTDDCVAAVLTFTTGVAIRNYSSTTDISAIA